MINGPKIILTKTVNKQTVNISELVTVNVNIKNVGDIGTRFEAIDPLPEDISPAEGVTSITNWSEPNTMLGFSYTIRMNKAGKVELPATVAHYTHMRLRIVQMQATLNYLLLLLIISMLSIKGQHDQY